MPTAALITLGLLLGGVPRTSPPVTDNWFNDFIGPPLETVDGRIVTAGAEYWSGVVGVAFDRDFDLIIPPTQLDLDLDRRPDTEFSGRWTLPGGLLANADQVGLIPTPDDPRGTPGRYSISTGYLGVRAERDPETNRPTGRYAFNCMLCHGGVDETGRILIGRPNPNIHLGLIMASSRVMDPAEVIRWPGNGAAVTPAELRRREGLDGSFTLDPDGDGRVTIAEWRRAMKLPSAAETRALLMLAGPGRLDQSVDPRMDGTIPLANLQQYWRQKHGPAGFLRTQKRVKRTAFNPVSLPAASVGLGVSQYSWTGKDSTWLHDAAGGIETRLKMSPERLAQLLGCPAEAATDHERLNRALSLDFRNIGTFARETDSPHADGWMARLLNAPSEQLLTETPPLYGANRLRELLTRGDLPAAAAESDPLIERGRAIFCEEETGSIVNQRIVLGRAVQAPPGVDAVTAIVPIDRSRPITERIAVRCGTCHNHTPTSALRPIATPLAPLQRCDVCHLDHPDSAGAGRFVALADHMRAEQLESVEACLACHAEHPDFGPQTYSNSWLLPFDANANGRTFGDERADAAAGGIGTDAYLAIDSLFSLQRAPPEVRARNRMLVLEGNRDEARPPRYATTGLGWVRVAPLVSLRYGAPFLHNGSVPTLAALLAPPAERPGRFPVGTPAQRFTFDAGLKGNLNGGHEYGTDLSARDREALIRYLESLP